MAAMALEIGESVWALGGGRARKGGKTLDLVRDGVKRRGSGGGSSTMKAIAARRLRAYDFHVGIRVAADLDSPDGSPQAAAVTGGITWPSM